MKRILLTFILSCSILLAHAISDANRDTLWHKISLDTFPGNFYFHEEQKTAQATLYDLSRHLEPHSEDYDYSLKSVLIFQALAGYYDVADSLIQVKAAVNSKMVNELIATKLYIQWLKCAQENTDSDCSKFQNDLQTFLRNNYISEDVNEAMKWHWIAKMVNDSVLINHTSDLFTYVPQLSEKDNTPQYRGAILATQRNPNSTNILVSDSYLQPIRLLELNEKGKWLDITSTASLDSIPGGERMYSVDINNDGYHDIVILRNITSYNSNYLYPSILINQKNGTYKDISLENGLNIPQRSVCACFFDADKDGRMDIFLGNEGYNSLLFLQKDSLKFVESANALGISTRPHKVVDCTVINNKFGVQNLYLSTYNYNNLLYEYQLLDNKYPFYLNKAFDYQFERPYKSANLLTGDFDGDGSINLLINSDHSKFDNSYMYHILSGSIDVDELPLMKDLSFEQDESEILPILSFMQSAVYVDTGTPQPYLFYTGGVQYYEFYPLVQFQHRKDHFFYQMFQLPHQPLFVNSMTVTPNPKTKQPILWMKGGSVYPLLKNKISAYQQNENKGKFIQIKLVGKKILDPIGATITLTTKNTNGVEIKRTRRHQVVDSQGKGAGQDLWWLPKNATLEKIQVTWPNNETCHYNQFKLKNNSITIMQK